MADVDVGWIVRQMIGSASKDFAKTAQHAIGEEAFRAEDICLPRADRRLRGRPRLALRAQRRDPRRLWSDGRGSQRVLRLRDGTTPPCVRADFHRGTSTRRASAT